MRLDAWTEIWILKKITNNEKQKLNKFQTLVILLFIFS